MKKTRIAFYVLICLASISKIFVFTEGKLNGTEKVPKEIESVNILPGVALQLTEKEINMKISMQSLLNGNVDSRSNDDENKGKLLLKPFKTPLFQRIGSIIMMIPMAIQMMSLPGAVASVKFSLLRSIMVANLAIVLMIYNVIVEPQQTTEVVILSHKQNHYDHHYHDLPNWEEDDEDAWFGK